MRVPTAYAGTYASSRSEDPGAVDNYLRHTEIGDPIMEELSASLSPADLNRFVAAGIEEEQETMRAAPQMLRDFFKDLGKPPWLDQEAFRPGVRAFHANVDLMLAAFVTGVLVEGFSTMIAKSFNITGRVASTRRRLQQNNRHMMDIFFPEGLRRDGDGWKLSIRIRFVHTRIGGLLAHSEEWDREAWGVPLSAAHLGFAISVFSKRLLDFSKLLGAKFNDEEGQSVLDVWRYAGYVMGIPETILYTSAESADRMYQTAYLCEPPPDEDSIAVANMLIQAIPAVADVEGEAAQESCGVSHTVFRGRSSERISPGHFISRPGPGGTGERSSSTGRNSVFCALWREVRRFEHTISPSFSRSRCTTTTG